MEKDYRIVEFNASLAKSNVKVNPQFIKTSPTILAGQPAHRGEIERPRGIQRAP
jgi:hypothetical protein